MRFQFILFIALFIPNAILAKPAPEFGPSVSFAPEYKNLSLQKLRGKGVLMVFFQSWCGICNNWAPDFFAQMEKKLASNNGLVKIALKTDGGGLGGAKNYLASKADLSKWIWGSDNNASYYKQIYGADKLYGYVLVGPDGKVVDKGKAGSYRSGSNPKRYVLAHRDFSSVLGDEVDTVIKKDYSKPFARAIQKAEVCMYGDALKECKKLKKYKQLKDELKSFKAEINESVAAKIEKLSKHLKDEESDDRFQAYMQLRSIASDLKREDNGKKAAKLVKEYKKDPSIKKELKVEKLYLSILKKTSRLNDKKKAKVLPEPLNKLANKYEGTYYAEVASALSASFK